MTPDTASFADIEFKLNGLRVLITGATLPVDGGWSAEGGDLPFGMEERES